MKLTTREFNTLTFFKLPSAWWTGVRLKSVNEKEAITTAKLGWRNQNPFKSMFWAVQGMAAEFATGALVIGYIRSTGKSISMLVVNNKANFSKKAVGRIHFTCVDGDKVEGAIAEAVKTGEGQTIWMQSVGRDSSGDIVSTFDFEWSIRVKQKK
ncbi:MAG: DUF4442 domain-containing protein [Flavobacteriaceae bacterium]|nr:DUF4442 domain-containing protein [Flavobacteriaceae bacterium]